MKARRRKRTLRGTYRNPAAAVNQCRRAGAESPGEIYSCALRSMPKVRGDAWAREAKRLARVTSPGISAAREPLTQKELDWRAKFNENTESTELVQEMTRLRTVQPRPLLKLWRSPTPEQRSEWEATNRQYNRLMSWLRKAHKVALERSNAAYRARNGIGAVRAKVPFQHGDRVVSDYRVAPFLRDDVLTVVEVKNLGTQKKPHWRVKVSSPRGDEGWLEGNTLSPA